MDPETFPSPRLCIHPLRSTIESTLQIGHQALIRWSRPFLWTRDRGLLVNRRQRLLLDHASTHCSFRSSVSCTCHSRCSLGRRIQRRMFKYVAHVQLFGLTLFFGFLQQSRSCKKLFFYDTIAEGSFNRALTMDQLCAHNEFGATRYLRGDIIDLVCHAWS